MPVPNAAEQLSLLQQSMLQMQQASMGSDESGLISGPIKRKRREKRELAAQQQLSAQTQAVEGQRAQALLSTFDPEQFPGTDLEKFAPLLADPATRELGLQRLQQIQAAGRAENTYQMQFNMAVAAETNTLRNAYHKRIAPVVESLQKIEFARGQLELGTPESALNGVRLFIQQLDDSMITNPEMENVMRQPGIAGQVDNVISWFKNQGSTDVASRKRMLDSMVMIGQVMEQYGQSIVQDMAGVVERSSLPVDPANVITMGGFANREWDLSLSGVGPPTGTATPPPATTNNDGSITAETNVGTRNLTRIE